MSCGFTKFHILRTNSAANDSPATSQEKQKRHFGLRRGISENPARTRNTAEPNPLPDLGHWGSAESACKTSGICWMKGAAQASLCPPSEPNVTDPAVNAHKKKRTTEALCAWETQYPGRLWQHPGLGSSQSCCFMMLEGLKQNECVCLFVFFSPCVNSGQLRSQSAAILPKQIFLAVLSGEHRGGRSPAAPIAGQTNTRPSLRTSWTSRGRGG